MKKEYVSERQRRYYEEILPKLSEEIQALDLGMRANTCLVSAGIFTLERFKKAVENEKNIPMLDKETREDIINRFGIQK